MTDAHEYKIGDDVLYRVNDGLWLPSKVVNITPRRIVIRPHGYRTHRNTLASQLRLIAKDSSSSAVTT
jgi:Tfp pilus assembly protein PilZ